MIIITHLVRIEKGDGREMPSFLPIFTQSFIDFIPVLCYDNSC